MSLASGIALAQVPEGATPDEKVTKVAESAISRDYRGRDFDKAKRRLQRAIKYCKKKQCSDQTKARLYRDLGVVLAGGLKDDRRGLAAFKKALQLDPKTTLDPDVAIWKLQQLFKEARKAAEPEAPPPPAAGQAPTAPAGVTHEPVAKAQVGFPVPIYAQLAEDAAGTELHLRYRPQGEEHWRTKPMKPVAEGYGAEIPCKWVGEPGVIEYYLHAVGGEEKGPVSGSKTEPHSLALKAESVGAAPSYPDQAPPAACEGAAAAAPPAEEAAAPAAAPTPPPVLPVAEPKKFWLQLTLQQDWTSVGGDRVCAIEGQNESFYCVKRLSDEQYIGLPAYDQGNEIDAGLRWSTTRALLTARIALGRASIGAAAGFAFRGSGWQPLGASRFLWLHLEARGSFWFLGNAFAPQFGMYGFAAFGIAQMDTEAETWVMEDPNQWPPVDQRPQDNPVGQPIGMDVVHRAGRHFGALGLGVFLPTSDHFGFVFEARGSYLFPATAPALSAGIGAALGF